jgi:hypothetical protein
LAARQLFAQTLKADYQFNNTRSSSVGGAPDLTDLGSGFNGFLTDNVGGTTQQVLHFPLGNGLPMDIELVLPDDVFARIDEARVENRQMLFGEDELVQLRRIRRLADDLGLNLAGIEVALRLLDEVARLQGRVAEHEDAR